MEKSNIILCFTNLIPSLEQMLFATWERIVRDTHFGWVHFETGSWGLLLFPECPWCSRHDGMMFWCSVLNCSFWNSYFQLFRLKSLIRCPDEIPPWHTSNSEFDLENWDCRISPPSNHWFSASGSAFKKWLVMNASEIPQEIRFQKSYSFNSLRKCIQQQLNCKDCQTQIGAQHSWNPQKRIEFIECKTNSMCQSSICKDWTDQ